MPSSQHRSRWIADFLALEQRDWVRYLNDLLTYSGWRSLLGIWIQNPLWVFVVSVSCLETVTGPRTMQANTAWHTMSVYSGDPFCLSLAPPAKNPGFTVACDPRLHFSIFSLSEVCTESVFSLGNNWKVQMQCD
jgi:hypothetical protein